MTSVTSNADKDITKWASGDGSFKRQVSKFRDTVEKGGKFEPETGRYHLYVSLACPWAHRTIIVRELKGLHNVLDVSVVHPHMGKLGWPFADRSSQDDTGNPLEMVNATEDKLYGSKHIRDLYFKADKDYQDRFTVPVLWDTKLQTVVNNESSEIIRMFNNAFDDLLPEDKKQLDFYPKELQKEIDDLNGWIYDTINNGVYKSGFASTQQAYEDAVVPLFKSLDRVEDMLKDGREYLVGGKLTEVDIRLYTTIVRFDPVYHGHFKCNLGMIRHSYPNINRWLKNLYWNNPAFKNTTDFTHIKQHYYWSHPQINPTRVVPLGPKEDIESL